MTESMEIQAAATQPVNYLLQRLEELGISDEQNTFIRTWKQKADRKDESTGKIVTEESQQAREYKFFSADAAGDIVIQYFNLDGQPYRWKKEDTKQTRDYTRKRLRVPIGDMKYFQEKGSPQFPFFPPGILKKYKANKEALLPDGKVPQSIETLFVVEGEFKAFRGDMEGLDIVGLPSIHGFYNGDVKGKLHEDIAELIITCQVEHIVFLVDADLLSVKWAEGKDLSKRPENFYGSVKAFRESLQLLIDNDNIHLKFVYFMHQNIKYMKDAKGLDDLFVRYPAKTEEIRKDLLQRNFARTFFSGMCINDLNKDVQGRLRKELGLTDEQDFYKLYKDFIEAKEFRFKNRRYIFDKEKNAVVFVKHEDAEKFMRIGPDWVKVIRTVNKHGEVEEELVPWKISEIVRDYGKRFPDFIDTIARYDGFCNEPIWLGNYQHTLHNCYNVCRPLKWSPIAGSIEKTIGFLKHIFGGQATVTLDNNGLFEKEDPINGDPFTIALDYLTIMLKHPKQMLPVPCLVSPEQGTGKSTFLKWLQMIFGDNMAILGNAQFQMKFNSHYATKYIISIDEGFLEVDKKAEKERLKQLVTADSIHLELKGMNMRKIPYYAKIIICSNDADRLMKIDEGESRWFVVRVPVIPKEKRNPDLELEMKNEANAWLHFLANRPIHHKRVDRLWFSPDDFITDQMRIIVEATKNRVDRVFEEWLSQQFLVFRKPVLRYTLSYLTSIFNDPKNSKYRMDTIELKQYLDKKGLKAGTPQRHKVPTGFDIPNEHDPAQVPRIIELDQMGRPFTFHATEWLNKEDLDEFNTPLTASRPAKDVQTELPLNKYAVELDSDTPPF